MDHWVLPLGNSSLSLLSTSDPAIGYGAPDTTVTGTRPLLAVSVTVWSPSTASWPSWASSAAPALATTADCWTGARRLGLAAQDEVAELLDQRPVATARSANPSTADPLGPDGRHRKSRSPTTTTETAGGRRQVTVRRTG